MLRFIPFFLMAVSLNAAISGEFLYIYNQVAGRGGIYGIDAASGANAFAIVPGSGTGFSTTNPPWPNPNIFEVSQARNNGRIAFSSTVNTSDARRIYVMNGDATGVTQVTFHNPAATPQDHTNPSISADGSKLSYINNETIAPPGSVSDNGYNCTGSETSGLWVVNADGTNPHLIRQQTWGLVSYCNAGGIVDAVMSPDGSKVLVKDTMGNSAANCGSELVVVNSADGSGAINLVCFNSASQWNDPALGLDWSPDGTKVMSIVPCGGGCTNWVIWDTSTWTVISTIPVPGGFEYATRFSPDSSLLGYYHNNTQQFVIMDLSGNIVSSFSSSYVQPGELWRGSGTPGTLASMSLGIPSVYVNACPNYAVQLQPSTFNSSGALVTHGYSGINGSISSGDGDSWHVDGFGNVYFNQTRGSGVGTLQAVSVGVSSNTIPLTADSSCTCQSAMAGLTVTRGGLRYVTSSQQQFVQTITVKNTTSSAVGGPVDVVIQNLTSTTILTNPGGTSGCTSSGSPFVTVVQPGGTLLPGQSASATLDFRDPSLGGFTYSTTVTAGAGAP